MTDVQTGLEIVTLETPSLGDRSYLAIADGWAVAIDPQRDIDRVERVLADSGLRLGAVLETHLHNDYVTGGRALALRNRATYAVPAGPRISYEARRVADGDELRVGPLVVRVIDAPGHTDAHAAYGVTQDGDVAGAVFTGGSLLLGGAGRTDLMGLERAETLARAQYRSVRRLGASLPAATLVCPTHGFGSYCAAGSPTGGGATIGDQRRANPAFRLDEDAFVDRLLQSLRPYPRYFASMAPRNAWFPTAANLGPVPEVPLDEVLALAAAAGAHGAGPDDAPVILDVRPRSAYAAGHVAGSLHIDGRGSLATWFGWLEPITTEVVLVASSPAEASSAQRELLRIGVDAIVGACIAPDLTSDPAVAQLPAVAILRRSSFRDLVTELGLGEDIVVLDVREADERRALRIAGSIGVPLHELPDADLESLRGRNVWVHCAAGFRATIAASILERAGIRCAIVDDLIDVAAELGLAGVPEPDEDATAVDAEHAGVPARPVVAPIAA